MWGIGWGRGGEVMVHVLCSVIQASQQGVSIKITEVGEDLLITTVLVSIYLSALLSTCIQECSYLHVDKLAKSNLE